MRRRRSTFYHAAGSDLLLAAGAHVDVLSRVIMLLVKVNRLLVLAGVKVIVTLLVGDWPINWRHRRFAIATVESSTAGTLVIVSGLWSLIAPIKNRRSRRTLSVADSGIFQSLRDVYS